MHILAGLLDLAVGAYFFFYRARNAVQIADDVADMAQTAVGAARRFGFRRRANVHPVDCIEDPKLAVAGLATAYAELDALPTQETRDALLVGFQSALDVSRNDAEELAVLGQWFVNECKGADAAVPRIARRLARMDGARGLVSVMEVIGQVAKTGDPAPSEKQAEALTEIKRIFKV
ncbi:MAG: hypothetical protein AAGM21_14875 [Pseudomonadota bacterium]